MKISKIEIKGLSKKLVKDSKVWRSLKKKGLIEYDRSSKEWILNSAGRDLFFKTVPENVRKEFYCSGFGWWAVDSSFRKEVSLKRSERSKRKIHKTQTAKKRLIVKKRRYVKNLIGSFFNSYEHFDVNFNAKCSKISIDSQLDWDGYSKSCKYPKTLYFISVDIAARTRQPIFEETDNIFNLAQYSEQKIDDTTVYEMDWLKKGRGYNFEIVHGWIAVQGKFSYHSTKDFDHALKGLERKIKIYKKKHPALTMDSVITLEKYRKITGACLSGCHNFLSKHNLPEDTKMKVKDLLPILKGEYGYQKLASIIV